MKYEKVKILSADQFQRVTGVQPKTFKKMVEGLTIANQIKKSKGSRPSKFGIEDKLLMALKYTREYRTYIHIATSYGLSESNTFETIR